ncbi:hypothetical protein B0O99DRAFT_520362 [Bisporella sp. PMI_857]|nr:hypothetical protein B0O99DRAFT_520362 [Bisporella sp. PMI_857]
MPSILSITFPPPPVLTEKNLPSQSGRVFIITGAASGVGFELAKILYTAGGTVYIAARSTSRCAGAITRIESKVKSRHGRLESMVVDLADLRTIKSGVESFLAKEQRLDVLVHNAAVMTPPEGSRDAQAHDLEVGTNALAPYLMTLLLEPILIRTATATPNVTPFATRIVWVVSALQLLRTKGGMDFQKDGSPAILANPMDNYMQSKVGASWLATEFGNRLGSNGILSVTVHPGFMKTELQRNWPKPVQFMMPAIYGAFSELYAGFSPDLKAEHNGGFVTAWGRIAEMHKDIAAGLKSEAEGGSGKARRFLEFADKEISGYA